MARNLRESVGSALASGDLTWDKSGEEAAVDRLVASAWTGDKLGRLLWRLKYAKEISTFNLRTALWMIVDKMNRPDQYGKHKEPPHLIPSCAAALDEWMNDACPTCEGRTYVRLEATPRACQRCAATGRISRTDEERAAVLGPHFKPKVYEKILQRLQEADHRQKKQTEKRRG